MSRFLVDLSAWARSSHPGSSDRWRELLEGDQLLCHPVFAIECLHNAITPQDYQELRNDLDAAFMWVRPDQETSELAMQLQRRMATGAACGQRVKTADLLSAALAVQHEVAVLHYDTDYDLIRDHGGEEFHSEWLAPRGTLETPQEHGVSERSAYRKAFGERMIQLRDDEDLVVWPRLVDWLDEQLESRGLPVPPSPSP